MKNTTTRQEEAKSALIENYGINASSQLIICITKVAASGMSQRMTVVLANDGNPYNITGFVAALLGLSRNDNGVLVKGCGMDMAFWLADAMTKALWTREERESMEFQGNGGSCLNWITI